MKIKNQFLISIIIFSIIVVLFAAFVFVAEQQTAQLNNQEALSRDIQTHASNLAYLSNDYFLYHDSTSLVQWQTEFSSLSDSLSKLGVSSPQQQTLLNKIKGDAQQLNSSWTIVALYLQNTPLNITVRNIPEFQADWSIMSAQNQALIFDAQQQSQVFHMQIDQLSLTTIILIFALLALFGAYFITNYLITYRNTLKSISELQNGIALIGSGNLDYIVKAGKKDEIGEVSKSVNNMAANLKTVTSSKTELERAQASLRESEQRWLTTLASIGDAVIATDVSGNVNFMNTVAEELTGWTLAEASNKPVEEVFNIVNEQSRLRVEDPVAKVLEKGMIVGLANHTVLIRKDGTDFPIDDSGAPIIDKEGKITGVVLIFRDISERKQNESKLDEYAKNLEGLVEERTKALKYSERLAAIGATAGMVGHDIRNPLQAITSDVYLAKSDLESVPECGEKLGIKESLDGIEKNVDYINKIVQDLQDFARPLNPKVEDSDFKQVVETLLAKNGLPENIKVNVKVADDAVKISADSYYLNRILFNLVTNAVQAMPNGGKLTIKAYKEANDIVIAVKDTGIGIPKDIQDKMFTLMFTTKSKGQGFGLPVVKRMTESLGGTVTFESQEGKGTTFMVRLPPKS